MKSESISLALLLGITCFSQVRVGTSLCSILKAEIFWVNLVFEMIRKKCNVSVSLKLNLYDVKRKPFHMPKYFFHKKRDFIFFFFFPSAFGGKTHTHVCKSQHFQRDETLFWQIPENRPINVVQTFLAVVAITDKATSKNLSLSNAYHQSTFFFKVLLCCFIDNV